MNDSNPNPTVDPRELLALPDAEIRARLEAMLPKPTLPEHLLGLWATHPEHGDVLVADDCPDDDGEVIVRWREGRERGGSCGKCVPVSELTFPHQATKPEDVPVGEAWLVNVKDATCSAKHVVALKFEGNDWRTGYGVVDGEAWWINDEVTLIAPLTPGLPATQEPEYVETEEEYEALPEGTIVGDYLAPNKRKPEVLWQKMPDGYWWSAGGGYSAHLPGQRRPVIRRGWGNE